MKEQYDRIYSEGESVFGGGKPESIVIDGANLLPEDSNVIEFGAGQGRNSIALAELGFNVEAVDVSETGVNFINNFGKEKSLSNLKARTGSAIDKIDDKYDMVVTTYMVHHLTREDALKFIEEIKAHTTEGGLNVISAFTVEGDFSKLPLEKGKFYPEPGEMRGLYSDWEIIKYSEDNSRAKATNPDGTPMFNIRAEILARKPKS